MSSENGKQEPNIPTKSSMEILSELFSTFHAEPPLIIKKEKSEESSRKHKKSKKKHKHKDKKHKKKEKKKRSSSISSSDGSEVDLAKILIKQEKEAAEKTIKIEGTEIALDIKTKIIKKEKHLEDTSEYSDKDKINDIKNKTKVKGLKLNSISESAINQTQHKVKRKVDEEGEISDSDSSISDKEHRSRKRHKQKSDPKKRSRSGSRDKSEKKLKADDLRNKLKIDKYKEKHSDRNSSNENERYERSSDKDFYKSSRHPRSSDDHKSRDRGRDRTRDRERGDRSKSRDRQKDSYNREIDDSKRHRTKANSFYKGDGFYKSRDREGKDEKWFMRDRDR